MSDCPRDKTPRQLRVTCLIIGDSLELGSVLWIGATLGLLLCDACRERLPDAAFMNGGLYSHYWFTGSPVGKL